MLSKLAWYTKYRLFTFFIHNMAGARLLGEEGFRGDGRKPNEIRHISGKMGVLKQAHGSAYLEQGDTKILAAVYGPHGVSALHSFVLGYDCLLLEGLRVFPSME